MDKFPETQFPALLGLLDVVHGNYPATGNVYHGSAKTLRTYSNGRVLTPDGEKELLFGADVSIKWIDDFLHKYMSEIGVDALIGMLDGTSYSESQQTVEMRRLVEINDKALQRIIPFYMTPGGIIYYKNAPQDPPASPLPKHYVGMFRVSEKEIPVAEHVLRTAKVVSYFPDWIIATVMGDDGTMLSANDLVHTQMFGEELRLIE